MSTDETGIHNRIFYEKPLFPHLVRDKIMVSNPKEAMSGHLDYDRVSRNYDYSRRAGKETAELLVKLLRPFTNAFVLDIGCGTGNFLVELANLPAHLVGLDISAGMLKEAEVKTSKAGLVRGDAVFMPFEDEAFDAVYCIWALHHISDKRRFMSEVYRILKNKGRFIIQSCSHKQLETFWFYHYFPGGLEVDKKRIPDFREIQDLLVGAGFKGISIHPCRYEAVFKETPELYLDKRYRDGGSTFSLLTTEEIEEGCNRIRHDIESGRTREIVAAFDHRAQVMGRVSFLRAAKP